MGMAPARGSSVSAPSPSFPSPSAYSLDVVYLESVAGEKDPSLPFALALSLEKW